MIKRYLFENYRTVLKQYQKLKRRLEREFISGSFFRLSFDKRLSLLKRLESLRKKLVVFKPSLKPVIAAGALAFAFNLSPVSAQGPFVEQTGANNPLNAVSGFDYTVVAFVDLDNDGDKDAVIGVDTYYSNSIRYFKNTGNSSSPTFTEQTGTNNPFNAITTSGYAAPTFADIDNDGDQDMVLGQDYDYYVDYLRYFKNTGNATTPTFTEQTGTNNPLSGITGLGDELTPYFVDIDNDGDKDLFVGEEDNTQIHYLKNTGTASVPAFTQQTGTNNPFNNLSTTLGSDAYRATVAFADLDGDGDFDAAVGYTFYDYSGYTYYSFGKIAYFRNTGTVTSPTFTMQTGSNDPFSAIELGSDAAAPSFVDIDADGDMDLFAGQENGTIEYYKNTGTPTGVVTVNINADLRVTPNPASTNIELVMKNHIKGTIDISLRNTTGMEVASESVDKNSQELKHPMNVENLTPGIYFLHIRNENNVGVVKFVKN